MRGFWRVGGGAAMAVAVLAGGCAPEAAPSLSVQALAANVQTPAEPEADDTPLTPDVEADAIPTFNGVPIVPVAADLPSMAPAQAIVRRRPHAYDTNRTAVELIKEEEQLRLEAYELGGLWLIGYGHLMLEGEKDVITEEEAEAFLVADLIWCEGALERMVETHVTHNEFSALAAFCYNVGSGKTRGSSIVKRLNAEDRQGAADAFLLWNRMNGKVMSALAKRRARERTLFLAP